MVIVKPPEEGEREKEGLFEQTAFYKCVNIDSLIKRIKTWRTRGKGPREKRYGTEAGNHSLADMENFLCLLVVGNEEEWNI